MCRSSRSRFYEYNVLHRLRIRAHEAEAAGHFPLQCLDWFRGDYDDANKRSDRTQYYRGELVPPELVKRWDAEI